MYAIYRKQLYRLVNNEILEDVVSGERMPVPFGSKHLTVDPTDAAWEEAKNWSQALLERCKDCKTVLDKLDDEGNIVTSLVDGEVIHELSNGNACPCTNEGIFCDDCIIKHSKHG